MTETETIPQLLSYLLGHDEGPIPIPPWPADVFAVTACILDKTGAYRDLVKIKDNQILDESSGLPCLMQEDLPDWIIEHGNKWAKDLNEKLKELDKLNNIFIDEGSASAIPKALQRCWTNIIESEYSLGEIARVEPNSKEIMHLRSCVALLCCAADQACKSLDYDNPQKDKLYEIAKIIKIKNDNTSLCDRVDPSKLRVLPKKHTPRCGLTLRSVSHYLSLIQGSEVEAKWYFTFRPKKKMDRLNLILFPWPQNIDKTDFKSATHKHDSMPKEHFGYFRYSREKRIPYFLDRLAGALQDARNYTDAVHGFIFPELSLKISEQKILEAFCVENELFYCAGIQSNDQNAFILNHHSFVDFPQDSKFGQIIQGKHHRWYLDRNQILQYGLGGMLSTDKQWWEYSHITSRKVHFLTFAPWLTVCTLICEDLARQDPVAQIIRSVGPNLVIALLMDGPQLPARWPSRYASVLAEDPGCSVLTLTSMGMVRLSNENHEKSSKVVALWRDVEGFRELELPDDKDAILLCLSPKPVLEFTTDGRLDQDAYTLTFNGKFALDSKITYKSK
jgi:hypothetical protein